MRLPCHHTRERKGKIPKRDTYLDLAREQKNALHHESDSGTNPT